MKKSFFTELIDFDENHDVELGLHYSNLVRCVGKNMWYDLDTGKLVPDRVFKLRIASTSEEDKIEAYSSNPEHPVFGSDVEDYLQNLGPEIVKYSQEVSILCQNIKTTLDSDPSLLKDFSQTLTFVSIELLQALRVNHILKPIMSKREVWEEIFRFSSATKREHNFKMPSDLHLDRVWIQAHSSRSQSRYVETIKTTMEENEMNGLVLTIASEQEFGTRTEVVLVGDQENSFVVTSTLEGYEVKRV